MSSSGMTGDTIRTTVERIERAKIEGCSDGRVLTRWYRERIDAIAELKAHIEAYQFAGTATDDWLKRSGGYLAVLKIQSRWIELRMLLLGIAVPYDPADPRTRHIRQLTEQTEKLKRLLRAAGVAVPGEDAREAAANG